MDKPQNPIKNFLHILNNRLLWLFILCSAAFIHTSYILFGIQIVAGAQHYELTTTRMERTFFIPSERGHIYDRFGRPLAINIPTHSVMLDANVSLSRPQAEINRTLLNLLHLLERNDEIFFDVLPVTEELPFEFTFSGVNLLGHRARFFREIAFTNDIPPTFEENEDGILIEVDPGLPVDAFFEAMISRFNMADLIEEEQLDPIQVRNLLSLRISLHLHRYRRFEPITISTDVGLDTIISIEEDAHAYAAAFITTHFLRYYPGGRYLAHIVGYLGNITENHDIEALQEDGYTLSDVIGHTGIELAFESALRGRRGQEQIYVDQLGRWLSSVPNSRIEPIHGSHVFLTIDKYLQIEAFHIVEQTLVDAIVARMTVPHHTQPMLYVQDVLASLIAANNINPTLIFEAEPGSISYQIQNFVLTREPEATVTTRAERNQVNRIIADGLIQGQITPNQAIVMLHEQGIIAPDDPHLRNRAMSGGVLTARDLVIESLQNGDITPQMTNVEPSTGSVVLTDVHTGEVLAAVNYPTFNTNELVNNMNNAYFAQLINDPTTPMVNRAFQERLAPGSVFKMITGIAGLEYGVITPHTRIFDQPIFTRAGMPYPTSWASTSLGNLTVAEAIAISSNYFFYETAFRLGEFGDGYTSLGIDRLNTYMRAFGLNDRSGVEIGEHMWGNDFQMASPSLQDFQYRLGGNPERQWTQGDTVRVAIGQNTNAYSAATMARLTAGLATRGQVVDLRLLDRVVSEDRIYRARTIPFDTGVEISDSTWDVTHQGMLWVTQPPPGVNSTLNTNVFAHFPFGVAAKTGTAEHEIPGRILSHTTFNAFAPFENPQVAIYVIIPFGATATVTPSLSSRIARDVLAVYFDLNPSEQAHTNDSKILMR